MAKAHQKLPSSSRVELYGSQRSGQCWVFPGPDGRARDTLVASRIIPLQKVTARMMTPVRRTSERTMTSRTAQFRMQQPHVKNQTAEALMHPRHCRCLNKAPILLNDRTF